MTTTAPVEDLLRDALDRLFAQERRTEALEAILFQLAPQTVPVRELPTPPHDTVVASDNDTRPQPHSERDSHTSSSEVELHHPNVPTPDPIANAVVDSLDDVLWSLSPDGEHVFFVGGAVERTFGRDAASLRDSPGVWLNVLPADDEHAFRSALARVAATDLLNIEHRVTAPNGAMRWLHSRGRLVRDTAGRPLRIHGISTDITPKVRTRRGLAAILESIGPATGDEFLARLVQAIADVLETRAAIVAVPDGPHSARTLAVSLDRRLATLFTFTITGGLMQDVFAGGSRVVPADARDLFPHDELLNRTRAESVVAEPLFDIEGHFLGVLAVLDDRPHRPTSPDFRGVLKALATRVSAAIAPPICRADLNAVVRAVVPVLTRIAGTRIGLDITLPPVLPAVRADANAVSLLLVQLVAGCSGTGTLTIRTATVEGAVALTLTTTGTLPADSCDRVRDTGGFAVLATTPDWCSTLRMTWPLAPTLRLA